MRDPYCFRISQYAMMRGVDAETYICRSSDLKSIENDRQFSVINTLEIDWKSTDVPYVLT